MRHKLFEIALGLLVSAGGALAQTNVIVTNVVASGAISTNFISASTNSISGKTAATNAAAANDAPVRMDSRYFQFVTTRNIFDQSRRPIRPSTNTSRPPPVRTETFTLTGVGLDNNQGAAMFDSSSSLYRKTLKAGDTIAGYRIAEITPDLAAIKLAASSNQVVMMKVGMEMRRRDNGPWLLASSVATVTPPSTEGDSTKSDSDTNSASSAASGGSADDIIKRLMEKRAKE